MMAVPELGEQQRREFPVTAAEATEVATAAAPALEGGNGGSPVDGRVPTPPNLSRGGIDGGGGDDDVEGEEDAAAETERPIQLDDNYYEIEAVRRKRIHKGQPQYLIKWRGWPETANTWEPLDNLLACSDVIDAFEEGLRSGKHRKRKRKSGGSTFQPKKQQQHQRVTPAAVNTNVPSANVRRIVDESVPSVLLNSMNLADPHISTEYSRPFGHEGENHTGGVNCLEIAKQADENWPKSQGRKEENELHTKLFELKGPSSTYEGNANEAATRLQETRVSGGGCAADGPSKVDNVEPVQTNRCTGARRRKSGSVKRFKQDSFFRAPNQVQDGIGRRMTIGSCGTAEWVGKQYPDSVVNDSPYKNECDDSRNTFSITKIIKPIGYSASVSNNVQDVSVTFTAMRSDGNEVTVDNKYLKANNPLLLINFYEQHLRYSSTP